MDSKKQQRKRGGQKRYHKLCMPSLPNYEEGGLCSHAPLYLFKPWAQRYIQYFWRGREGLSIITVPQSDTLILPRYLQLFIMLNIYLQGSVNNKEKVTLRDA